MSAIVKGRGVMWSIGGVTFTAGIVSGTNTSLPQSVSFKRMSEKTEVLNINGSAVSEIFHGFKKTSSMTIVPSGTSIALASTSMDAYHLAAGMKITVADAVGTILDGNYILLSATQNRTIDGVATIDIELENGDEGVDYSTTVT
jgi:hypothetical protein